ncbi:hypothetical protein M378DRAFT_172149 [Amanita muscaria Koide BX008]|uniref:Uncharacterized protein n=1 Tax=Amanita muscaria (strain Koide BX008) TaxID=946122 RepID=A0A0C2WK83_AMAMK|nr:hypothetical protein M378DRAFT_172149 [Amanita muscaria Koide BX008]
MSMLVSRTSGGGKKKNTESVKAQKATSTAREAPILVRIVQYQGSNCLLDANDPTTTVVAR